MSLRGRFDRPVGDDMVRFSASLDVDLRMLDDDVEGSKAHARMLGECGLLASEEVDAIVRGLEEVRDELRSGAWVPGDELEDVHMAIEHRLVERIGEVGKKLHTARSRNDQVATDVRLWTRRHLDVLDRALVRLGKALVDRAESDGHALLPGYTHLQRGQPILLGHWLLAHAWSVDRDRGRIDDARGRLNRSPLGACALAGTPHPIDREATAAALGFDGVVENAMDAVAARDHLQEVAAACSIAAVHLSRISEELVLWSSDEFRFFRSGDAYATSSSVMPQKRNPDALELVRGKTARVLGASQSLLVLTKSLPMAYNRDLQEDRHALFDAVDTVTACASVLAGVLETGSFVRERFEDALRGDPCLATELADWLASRGVPFRDAHGAVARLVHHCEEEGLALDALSVERAATFHPALGEADLASLLDPRRAAERRTSRGGTAPGEIDRQIAMLRTRGFVDA